MRNRNPNARGYSYKAAMVAAGYTPNQCAYGLASAYALHGMGMLPVGTLRP
jgi:hypothetical protein